MSRENQKGGRNKRPLSFATLDNGCIVLCSHKPRSTGYFYYALDGRNEEPLHRILYRLHNGDAALPDGWEVDHHCNNRWCCNPRHLRALSRSDHRHYTNARRWDECAEVLRLHWLAHGKTLGPNDLAAITSIRPNALRHWIREWNEEDAEWDAAKAARQAIV